MGGRPELLSEYMRATLHKEDAKMLFSSGGLRKIFRNFQKEIFSDFIGRASVIAVKWS